MGVGGHTMEIKGKKTNIQIKTLNGEDTLESEAISWLKLSQPIRTPVWIDLLVTYSKIDLLVGDKDVLTTNKIKEWYPDRKY